MIVFAGLMSVKKLEPRNFVRRPDIDGDNVVGATDLAVVLGGWGGAGPGDFNADGTVNAADLAILLGAWGPCP